jgi:UDP-N-acetylmuramate--alanine ligase
MEFRGKWQMANGKWRRTNEPKRLKQSVKNYKPYALSPALVYDDYAHHPTEIKATLAAFKERFPNRKLVCVFQPHQAERLKRLWNEFESAFDLADITLVLPLYRVAGRDRADSAYDSARLVRAIQKKYPKKLIFYLENPKNLKKALTTLLQPSSRKPKTHNRKAIIAMMGAGNIVDYTSSLIR